jgi:hypothetical protein
MAHLRAIGQAFHSYVADNKGYGSLTNFADRRPDGSTFNNFWFAASDLTLPVGQRWNWSGGFLAKYIQFKGITECPSLMDAPGVVTTDPDMPRISYGYNTQAGRNFNGPERVVRFSSIKKPDETMALLDSAIVNFDGSFSYSYASNPPLVKVGALVGKNPPTFQGRHRGKGNVLWYSGHVTTQAPYFSSHPNNYTASNFQHVEVVRRNKLGWLTPYQQNEIPETDLMNDFRVSYYYFVNKNSYDGMK